MTGAEFGGATTLTENGARAVLAWPSLTLIVMLPYVPIDAVVGVPEIRPVALLNVAHDGTFCAANVTASPFGSLAEGWNA